MDLRKRHSSAGNSLSNPISHDEDGNDINDPRFTNGLTAPNLLRASPQHQGPAMKLHVPLLYVFLPRLLQSIIQRIHFLSTWFAPRWKYRYMILLGSYLYRFSDETHREKGPKGSPIALSSVSFATIPIQTLEDDIGICSLPQGFTTIIRISTINKRQYIAVQSREHANEWMHALQLARHEATRRSLGHAPEDSVPKSWLYYDALGTSFAARKERVRMAMEKKNRQDIEMTCLNHTGPMPCGSFG